MSTGVHEFGREGVKPFPNAPTFPQPESESGAGHIGLVAGLDTAQLVQVLDRCSAGGTGAAVDKAIDQLSQMAFEVLVNLLVGASHRDRALAFGITCAHRAAMARAILDSRASSSFVPPEVILANVRPGQV